MTPKKFVAAVRDLSFVNAFNPYSDRCPRFDNLDAPKQRSKTLHQMLEAAAERKIDAIWIGRDLGYRGGRRTGLALTDDVHSAVHLARWGVEYQRPTVGDQVAERTASVIWQLLSQIDASIFLWNVFPLHPHLPNDPFSNRSHNSAERKAGQAVLLQLIEFLNPRRLVAIGNDAALACHELPHACTVTKVRHPSYGGQTQFESEIRQEYRLPRKDAEQQSLRFA